jgi:hypothetical protein
MSDTYYEPTGTERFDAAVAAYMGSDTETSDALAWLHQLIDQADSDVPLWLRVRTVEWFRNVTAWDDAVRDTIP